jgi:hypothetical protein
MGKSNLASIKISFKSAGILSPCRGKKASKEPFQGMKRNNITFSYVSNESISSYEPPLVMDTIACVHTLSGAPFSFFVHKLGCAAKIFVLTRTVSQSLESRPQQWQESSVRKAFEAGRCVCSGVRCRPT